MYQYKPLELISFNALSNLRIIIFLYYVPMNPPIVSEDLGLTIIYLLNSAKTSICLDLLFLNFSLNMLCFELISLIGDCALYAFCKFLFLIILRVNLLATRCLAHLFYSFSISSFSFFALFAFLLAAFSSIILLFLSLYFYFFFSCSKYSL